MGALHVLRWCAIMAFLFEKSPMWRRYVASTSSRWVLYGSAFGFTAVGMAMGYVGLEAQAKWGVKPEDLEAMRKADPNGGRMRTVGRMKIQQMFDNLDLPEDIQKKHGLGQHGQQAPVPSDSTKKEKRAVSDVVMSKKFRETE